MLRLHRTLVFFVLLVAGASAALTAEQRKTKFDTLARRGGGSVSLNTNLFDELLAPPRAYSMSVLLNALAPQYNCHACRVLSPEHQVVASQWLKTKNHSSHYFTELDFSKGQKIFQRYGLQTAPILLVFPPTDAKTLLDDTDPIKFDPSTTGRLNAEGYADLISRSANLNFAFSRPIDWGYVAIMAGNALGLFVIGYFTKGFWFSFFTSRYIYVMATLSIIIVMTSGFMWNKIRMPRFNGRTANGVQYIEGGFQSQFADETGIMSAVYFACALGVIVLVSFAPTVKDPAKQRFVIYVWTFGSLLFASCLYRIFQIKQPQYPYHLI